MKPSDATRDFLRDLKDRRPSVHDICVVLQAAEDGLIVRVSSGRESWWAMTSSGEEVLNEVGRVRG